MKKFIVTLCIILSGLVATQAQLRVGVKVGANQSSLRVNSSEGSFFSNDHYRNFHGGLVAELNLSNNLYLQGQLLYTRKGSTLLSSVGAPDTKLRVNYVEAPVMLLYKLPVGFGKLFAGAGASVAYGIGGHTEQAGQTTKLYRGANDNWKRVDLGLQFTAGVELNNGLFASVNSQKGLRDIYKGAGTSVRNRTLSLSVGYMFDLGKLKSKRS